MAPVEATTDLPAWLVVFLIWSNGGLLAVVGGLVFHMIRERSFALGLAAVEAKASQQVTAANLEIVGLKREVYGIDGGNGVRGDTKALKRTVAAIATAVDRLATKGGVDLTDIRESLHLE